MNPQLKHLIETTADNTAIQGWCTKEKAIRLAELISQYNPKLIVEVGVFGGKSLIPMAQAARASGSGLVYGIDPWEAPAALEGEKDEANRKWWENLDYEDVYRRFINNVISLGLTYECRWIRAHSEKAASLFSDASIDFFHLDSNHSELASCRDVNTWKNKLSENAIWVLDDSDWKTQGKAIDLIRDAGFALIEDAGKHMIFRRGG